MPDSEFEQMTGFVICEFPPDNDPCESCGEPNKQLYYLGPRDAATYLCRECVVRLYEKNLEWGKALIGVQDGEGDGVTTQS